MDSTTPANTCIRRIQSMEQPELARTRPSGEDSGKPSGLEEDETGSEFIQLSGDSVVSTGGLLKQRL